MCIIVPVDHVPCTHTIAIWQHCVNAPRSKTNGEFELCSNIRQHARPIVTRKLCFHCGGSRYFARRGGIAERGRGSGSWELRRENDGEDSGYASDAVAEEDRADSDEHEREEDTDYTEDEDESDISPRHTLPPRPLFPSQVSKKRPPRPKTKTKTKSQSDVKSNQGNSAGQPQPLSRKPSWHPSLKLELLKLQIHASPFPRRESSEEKLQGQETGQEHDQEHEQFEDGIGRVRQSVWMAGDITLNN